MFFLACAVSEPPTCEGEALFGAPSEYTGLDTATCTTTCPDCGGDAWTQPDYAAVLDDWRAQVLLDPPAPPAEDPYAAPEAVEDPPDAVCAWIPEEGGYTLGDFPSSRDARRAGGVPTHYGRCGLCSSLQDLAVYAGTPELTEPVRACGLAHYAGPPEEHVACLEALGFSSPCAWIWYYNTVHTREACGDVCLAKLDEPWNLPSGALNGCLACDEAESGEVFKAVAGRTRRNTGLASSICRPCSEVRPLDHAYDP